MATALMSEGIPPPLSLLPPSIPSASARVAQQAPSTQRQLHQDGDEETAQVEAAAVKQKALLRLQRWSASDFSVAKDFVAASASARER